MTQKELTKTCTAHCRGCDRHFHGDSAFDVHRMALTCVDPETRVNKRNEPLLAIWTDTGACTLQAASAVAPCVIWHSARGYGE